MRIAAADDREALLHLVTSAFAYGAGARGTALRLAALPNDPEGLVETMLANNDVVALIGEVGGITSGFALILTGPPRLVAIFVAPDVRRRGLGRALVGYAETLAVTSMGDALTAVAGAGNRAEKSLYEALGYRAELLTMAARRA